ncbi:MAG TPA: hypothetical protein VG123_43245, partial [Streptosporangiaceae bacterium]|nr:hypothetical protein [Streptosporangiaceae bacterium]
MTSGNDAGQWHETAQHLVQAHGALPGALTSYSPTLEQLRFAHADTHEALAGTGAAAPDGHTHTGSLDPGYPCARDSSFRPYPPGEPSMTSGDDARQWQETAQHLVQAHDALPGALTSYAPTL